MLKRKTLITFMIRVKYIWQGKKDSNLRMPESKSGALTNLATPLEDAYCIAI